MKQRIARVLVLMMIACSLFGCAKANKESTRADSGSDGRKAATSQVYAKDNAQAAAESKTSNEAMVDYGEYVPAATQVPMEYENFTSTMEKASNDAAPIIDNSQPDFNTEEYNKLTENGFHATLNYPISTFSADVDTASYSNVRRMLQDGWFDNGAVRIEELINYFDYDYNNPNGEHPFGVTTELANCPWNPDTKLMLVGIKSKDIDFSESSDSNLVFLIDVSGSMYDYDKLPLVQQAFGLLTDNLTEKDRISIVTYAGEDKVVLEGARGNEKTKIMSAINELTAGGCTQGSAGIQTAYEIAKEYFIEGGNNRVILATDGDLNVGITSESGLTDLIKEKKESGIYLSVLGFGSGNYKDNKMEALADNGNGNYSYIDSLTEAKKVLVEEMGSTLVTVAEDVKFQVEFNPANVKGYRLIGYENRMLNTEDFEDDTKDAGEVGAGHTVTVLYEVALSDSKMELPVTELKYQNNENKADSSDLATVSIRYKKPGEKTSILMNQAVNKQDSYEKMPENLCFASAVAEFGMLLRESQFKGTSSYDGILQQLGTVNVTTDPYRTEFVSLVYMAKNMFNAE